MATQESPTDTSVSQQPGQATPTQGATSASGENLQCQWVGCGERCTTAELLYDHVCERHVGRKSTNNLNLTCQWGSCRTTTVKRDHITSHIRVHVPLKPHKCEFCGKAFKRPQDLKKHVKTHADDSVILRSPGPDNAGGRPANVYNVSNGKASSAFYEAPMNPGSAPTYTHAPNAYYQPQPQQHASDYGTVYYGTNGANEAGHQFNNASQKRGFDALNDLFGDLKRRHIDPSNYAAFGQRLYDLQALQLPVLQNTAIPEYQQMPAMATAGGDEGYHPSSMPSYSLPPMGNVRTKGDLMNLDQLLETMQTTIYENPNHVAAAGVAQPGAYHIQAGAHYRTSNSPPGHQLPSGHATASAHMMASTPTESAQSGTPALTPPSSAQSYTSGHSPSMPATQHMSPVPQNNGGMYPSLPSTSMQDSMASGYPPTSGAPTSTLGTSFDTDDRRRYGGGTLQRAQPARRGDEMDMSEDSPTPPAKASPTMSTPARKPKNTELASSLIDPALNGLASPSTGEETADEKAQEQWVENIRLVEWLREYVKGRLQRGQFDVEDENEEMRDVDHEEEAKLDPALSQVTKEEQGLYPSLKGLEAES